MKNAMKFLAKITPALTACMTVVLTISANSSSCFIFNEPKAPKGLDNFKRIK